MVYTEETKSVPNGIINKSPKPKETTINAEEKTVLNGTTEKALKKQFSFSGTSYRQKLILLSVGFSNICGFSCFALFAPFFPSEAAKKGASQTVVGLVFGCFQFVIFISSLFYGNYVTKIGAKFMFVTGLSISGTCAILFGLLNKSPDGAVFIIMVFVTRTFEGLGTAAFQTAGLAILGHEFPDALARVAGFVETCASIGFMIGSPIGGVLYELGGFGLPFFVMGGMMVFWTIFAYVLLPPQTDLIESPQSSILDLFKSPLALIAWFATFSFYFSIGFKDATLAQHLNKLKLKVAYSGFIFFIPAFVFAVTSPLFGWITDAKGWDRSMIAVSCFGGGIAFLVLGPVPFLSFIPFKLYTTIIAMFVYGLTLSGGIIPTYQVVRTAARQLGHADTLATYGKIAGFILSSFALGGFLGPIIGGISAEKIGFPWAASVCSYLLFIFGLAMWIHIIWEQCSMKRYSKEYKNLEGNGYPLSEDFQKYSHSKALNQICE